MTTEKDIVHDNGRYWVLDQRGTNASYIVMKDGITTSESDSAYPRSPDGLSLAIARCNYLAKKNSK